MARTLIMFQEPLHVYLQCHVLRAHIPISTCITRTHTCTYLDQPCHRAVGQRAALGPPPQAVGRWRKDRSSSA